MIKRYLEVETTNFLKIGRFDQNLKILLLEVVTSGSCCTSGSYMETTSKIEISTSWRETQTSFNCIV